MAQKASYTDLGNAGYAWPVSKSVSDGGAAVVIAGSGKLDDTFSHRAYLRNGGTLTPLQDYGQGSVAMAISANGNAIAGYIKVPNQLGSNFMLPFGMHLGSCRIWTFGREKRICGPLPLA